MGARPRGNERRRASASLDVRPGSLMQASVSCSSRRRHTICSRDWSSDVCSSDLYVTTSRDAHMASRMIKRSVITGLLSTGVKVGDLRTAPIPVVRYEIGQEGEVGGVHVRQSPFDPNLIDIKLLDKTGVDLSSGQERSIEQLFLREDFQRATPDRVGELITPPRAKEYYRAGFLKAIDARTFNDAKMKIVIDYAFSSAS